MRRFVGFCLILFTAVNMTMCKNEKIVGENPFFVEWQTQYGVPPFDKIEAKHYLPAFEQAISIQNAEIAAIVENNSEATFENSVLAFDNSGKLLTQVSLVFSMICSAEITPELQELQETIFPMLTGHYDKMMLNDGLFQRVKSVYDVRASIDLDADQKRLLELTYNSFVRSGALLDDKTKDRLKQINEELSMLSVKYGNNILAENNNFVLELGKDELEGLPSGVKSAAQERAEDMGMKNKWVFTLQKPSLLPFITYSDERELREKIYTAYLNRGNNGDAYDNKALVNDFIRLRTEKAHLLGFDSYADYVISDQMAKSPKAVYSLLDQIWTPGLERAKGELKEMDVMLQKDQAGAVFESWDWWYYAEKVRKQKYSLDEEMLKPYFSLESVQSGIFLLANRLYGITFRPVITPLYHKDVSAYQVEDVDGSHLGLLLMDFFPRKGKSGGAWCGNYTEQIYQDGERVAPVVSIVCNFTPPLRSTPSLLTIDETETFFHEFGHALHFLFHDVKYRGLTDVEGDFVELPSQIMENWAFEPELLKLYAINYRSSNVISDFLIEKIKSASLFNQGFATTELVGAALSDLDIHSTTNYEEFDVEQYETEALREKRGLIPQIAPRYRYPYFSHIFDGGYSAGYYFYIWAEVLDKDAFEAFRESGDLFNRRLANDFRHKILERGGSEDGMTMYRSFRGAEPDKEAMLKGRGLLD